MKYISHLARFFLLGILCTLMGCTTWKVESTSDDLWKSEHYEDAVRTLKEGAEAQPDKAELKSRYLHYRNQLFSLWMDQFNADLRNQHWAEAETLQQRALKFEPENSQFIDAGRRLQHEKQAWQHYLEAQKLADKHPMAALNIIDAALRDAPEHAGLRQLKDTLEQHMRERAEQARKRQEKNIKVNINFKDAPIRLVLEAIGRSSGVQFNIDPDLKSDQKVSIHAKNQPLPDVMEWLGESAKIGFRIINPTLWDVYPNTEEKRHQHEELVMKTYTLAHASAKTLGADLKSMFGLKDMIIDERLNMLILREPADTIHVIDDVIQQLDQLEPEVLLEVDIMEVSRNRLLQLGIEPPTQLALTPVTPASGVFTLHDLAHLTTDQIAANIGGANIDFNHTLSDSDVLASPRLRVKNHGKASILIGDKIPTITTTLGGSAAGYVSESVNYTDVGIKFNIENVAIAKDQHVQLKLKMEVSNIVNQVTTHNGTIAYQLGTREAETELAIRDGETQVLAGLISNNDTTSGNRLPIFGDIPILGRIFGSTTDNHQKSEIVLSITPRILRNLPTHNASDTEILSGTQQHIRFEQPFDSVSEETFSASKTPASLLPTDTNSTLAPNISDEKPTDAQDDNATKNITNKAPTKIELYWQNPPASGKTGQSLTLQLKLKTDGGLRGMPIQLKLDPKQWAVEQVEAGNFFNQGNGNTLFSHQILQDGRIMASIQRSQSDVVMGDDTLLTLKVHPVQTGKLPITINSATPMGLDHVPNATLPPALMVDVK